MTATSVSGERRKKPEWGREIKKREAEERKRRWLTLNVRKTRKGFQAPPVEH
jgi:hypothetical protein